MNKIQRMLKDLDDDQLRYALISAVIFADKCSDMFRASHGEYGSVGIDRLLEELEQAE